jgi:hypothetical protein
MPPLLQLSLQQQPAYSCWWPHTAQVQILYTWVLLRSSVWVIMVPLPLICTSRGGCHLNSLWPCRAGIRHELDGITGMGITK